MKLDLQNGMKNLIVNVDQMQFFVIINNFGIKINVELIKINKGICDKGFIWNPGNCECECDKSCNIGEYLDYENSKCRKKLVDQIIHECTETIS